MDAKLYRAEALTMLALADGVDDPAVRMELLELARRFIQLAQHAETFGERYGAYFGPEWTGRHKNLNEAPGSDAIASVRRRTGRAG